MMNKTILVHAVDGAFVMRSITANLPEELRSIA